MNQKLELFKKSIIGKKIAVIGIGVSNTPLIKFLRNNGADVSAFDQKTKEQLGEVYNELKDMGVTFFFGSNYLSNLNHEIIFKTPGMRFDIPELIKAKHEGSIITSEMEIFFDLCPAKIIGVTGSEGKTTTTTIIYKILEKEGYTCWLGGNIGRPLLSEIEKILPEHKVVLELSSFQLHTMKASPNIAVVTNISPNHLDVHKSMEEYIDAKKNIFIYQSKGSKLVLNYNNDITREFANEAIGEVTFFNRFNNLQRGVFLDNNFICIDTPERKVINIDDIKLLGIHNTENYMAAIAAVREFVNEKSIVEVATTFYGVEHRNEFVGVVGGVKFYNDSKATTPTSTIAALNSFKQKMILIAGGYDKKVPFDVLGSIILERVKSLILIGETAGIIEEAVRNRAKTEGKALPVIQKCISLEQAVHKAYKCANKSDIVILSPACASYDMFKNFEVRGNMYKEIIKGLQS